MVLGHKVGDDDHIYAKIFLPLPHENKEAEVMAEQEGNYECFTVSELVLLGS